jgi:fucose permease
MSIIEPRHRRLFLVLFTVFTLFGTSFTVIGATLPKILADFHWNYLIAGTVLGASAVTYFVSAFAAGHLVKLWGPKRTIVSGIVLDVIGLTFFAANADPLTNILLSALIGLGQGCVEIGVSWCTLRIDRENTGRPMNLMHGAFAVGAILGPLSVGVLMHSGLDWTAVYRGMAIIFALIAAMVLLTELPAVVPQITESGEKPERLSKNPAYWLSFLALFLYVGVELGVSNWVAEYFVAVFAYSSAASAMLVSLFWVGLLVGRFGVPLLYKGARQDAILVGLSALAALSVVSLTLLGFTTLNPVTDDIGRVLVFLAGLGCSIYYPAVITLLGKCFPHAQSQAIGFAATGGGIGAFLFPFIMSAISQNWGIRAGFATYAIFAVAMTVVAAWLSILAKMSHTSASKIVRSARSERVVESGKTG